jgi:translation initiation factor 4E
MTAISHPLNSGFTFSLMKRGKGGGSSKPAADDADKDANGVAYESGIKAISTFRTVEDFWGTYNFLMRPDALPNTSDYHLFREGVTPTWEDSANAKGGKWIVRLRKGLASRYWEEIVLAIIGEQLDSSGSEVCGAVMSIRHSEDLISVWNRSADNAEVTGKIRDNIKKILHLPGYANMEYKPHMASIQDKSSFRNTQVWKQR